jgi:response regulator RpfG family c-di-GMP phosphodiesterase/serine/threonine protein kinase
MRPFSRKSAEARRLTDTQAESEPGAGQLVDEFLSAGYMLTEDWDGLPLQVQEQLLWAKDRNALMRLLIDHGLLTQYQAARIQSGTTFGLVLGSYRVLDRIGAGGMAVVFKAEHIDLRHLVAVKVLPLSPGQDGRVENRFFAEMRVVSRLHHPNIVAATDAGKIINPDPNGPSLRYLVMEYITGKDLEDYVHEVGPLPLTRGCSLIYQIASALAETHKYNLVHRDIKPSNIMITSEEQAKLLDFGLSLHFTNRLTQPGTVLGTLDFMAPEQAKDATTVDVRADLYSLGGTLYWCLTGKLPFPSDGNPIETLAKRINQDPPSLKDALHSCPIELDLILRRMMAKDPSDRYQTPQAVMQALLPFLKVDDAEYLPVTRTPLSVFGLKNGPAATRISSLGNGASRVLLVDDEKSVRQFCLQLLSAQGMQCDEVCNGEDALSAIQKNSYDLVLLDVNLGLENGADVLVKIREHATSQHLKVMMLSGHTSPDEMASMLLKGADDYLSKPFSVVQFVGRVKAALRLKSAQDRSIVLNQQLLALNAELESNLRMRDNDLAHTRNSLVLALAKLAEQRDSRSDGHILRMQRYVRVLSDAASAHSMFQDEINEHFIDMIECCVPLHDIGKVSLPDHLLMKAGTFSPEERLLMQTHTILGSEALQEIAKKHPSCVAFLRMAIDIVRHHHERFDGTGYPDRLVGSAIPLAARIVAICDVYDALRSRRVYKPPLSHNATVQIMVESSQGQFDPCLIQLFSSIAQKFDVSYRELAF